jgi:VIT1/CCC1 family predicted Fe2+/Mn2+ transporter
VAEHYDKKVKNMDRKSILNRLDTTLILFELVLSVVFIVAGHLIDNNYIRGVGIGLTIAWVTSAIAYLYKKKMVKP